MSEVSFPAKSSPVPKFPLPYTKLGYYLVLLNRGLLSYGILQSMTETRVL